MKKRFLLSFFIFMLLVTGGVFVSATHGAAAYGDFDDDDDDDDYDYYYDNSNEKLGCIIRSTEDSGMQIKGLLNISSVTLYKGESVVLEVSDLPEGSTVTYASSSKKKASVDKNSGRVKALKKGSATITATISVPAGDYHSAYSYKLKCKVKVKNGSAKSISTLSQLKSALTDKKGGRYKLTADIKGMTHVRITAGTYRLDLNGHKITGSSSGSEGSLIEVYGGDLTITDSKGKGAIVNDNQDPVTSLKGNLSIYGGAYEGFHYALYLDAQGNVTIYNGDFKGNSRILQQYGGTLTINGGRFTGEETGLELRGGKTTINGGCFTQKAELQILYPVYPLWVAAFNKNSILDLTINGGHFFTDSSITAFISGEYANVAINGGFFESTDHEVFYQTGGRTVISGGYFYFPKLDGMAFGIEDADEKLSFTMKGGCIVTETSGFFFLRSTSDVSIQGGTFIKKAPDYNHWSDAVWVYEDFNGKFDLVNGLFEEDEVDDWTADGQGITVFEFTRNKTTYKEGMTVSTPDDLYSMYMDAVEQLTPKISFTCTSEIATLMEFYYTKWCDGFKDTHIFIDRGYDDEDSPVEISLEVEGYTLEYQIACIDVNKKAEKNASKEAIALNSKINSIIKSVIKKGMTDKEKAIAIHDYMVKNYEYDYSFAPESYEITGLLNYNKGVCQAYANLFRIFCGRVGIECSCINGMGGNEGNIGLHMWNRVIIDGKELYIDVTFDDSSSTNWWLLKEEADFYGLGYHFPFEID